VSLRALCERFLEQVQFLSIYIREAHPVDGWWFGEGLLGWLVRKRIPQAAYHVYDPQDFEERRALAGECEASLKYGIPTLVDGMNDRVSQAYAARPTRLYLVGEDGRVAYAGGLGPWGFKPHELEGAIEIYFS